MQKAICNFVTVRAIAFLFTCAAPCLFGQATSGTMIGTVHDSSGAIVSGAKVSITDIGKGVTNTVTTNADGNYTQTQLTPGSYEISVAKPGFKKFQQQNVTVNVGRAARVDATLQIGEATQEVTVSSAPPELETDRAEVQTHLGAQQISSLPVINRNFTNLTLLTPGATLNTFQHAASENPQQSTLVNTNGQLFGGTNYQLDGMNNNDSVLGIIMVNPAVDSVAEFTASTSNYDAEYRATGAVINVETKSGTNQLHGSAFEFLQNNIFEARDPFNQGLHAPGTPVPAHRGIPELRYNQFGATIGGPIKKDKLFFFGDYQGTQRRMGASETLRVPTLLERQGNLNDLPTRIYDPNTGNANGTGRTLFTGNQIPTNRLSAPALAVLNALPLPNIPGAGANAYNYAASGVETYPTNQFDARVDDYLTEKLHYFARYSYLQAQPNAPAPFGLYGGNSFPTLGFEGLSDALNQNVASDITYTVSPSLLTDVRIGFSRYRVTISTPDESQQLATSIGIPGLNIPGRPDTYGLPQFNINGLGGVQTGGGGPTNVAGLNLGYNCNCPLHERETLLDFVNDWTKIAGNHTIKFGGDVELAWNLRLPSDNHRSGVYQFAPSVTSSASDPGSGIGLATYLLGDPSQFNRFAQVSTNQEDRQNRMFYFVQDSWRVTPKLTFNYGVRWDTWFPDMSLNAGQGGRYNVVNNQVMIPGVGGISLSANSQTQWKNISPRIGVAYAFDQKTVLRAGYGRGYSQGIFGWTFNNMDADVYPSIVNQQVSQTSPFQPIFPLATAPPSVVFPAIPANGMFSLPPGISTPYIPANLKLPYVDQWNLTVERDLGGGLNLSVGYVGNVGRHLNGGYNLNAAIPGPGPLTSREPLYQRFAAIGMPGINQTINDKCDCTSSNYNGLQVQASKRYTNGYSLQVSYTYSKAMDFGQATFLSTNQYDARTSYGPADFDREQVLTIGHTYELPFGPGHHLLSDSHGVVRQLVAGWSFSGITTLESGLPFSPTLANSSNLNSNQSERPNAIGNPTSGFSQNRNEWFNPADFSTPGLYTFGDAGRNSLRGPSLFQADWSLAKNFHFAERYSLQFRWDVYNAFNVTNLGQPSTAVDGSSPGVIQDIIQGSQMRNMQFGADFRF